MRGERRELEKGGKRGNPTKVCSERLQLYFIWPAYRASQWLSDILVYFFSQDLCHATSFTWGSCSHLRIESGTNVWETLLSSFLSNGSLFYGSPLHSDGVKVSPELPPPKCWLWFSPHTNPRVNMGEKGSKEDKHHGKAQRETGFDLRSQGLLD